MSQNDHGIESLSVVDASNKAVSKTLNRYAFTYFFFFKFYI